MTPSSGVLRQGVSKAQTRSSIERRLSRSTALGASTRASKTDLSGRARGVAQVVGEEGVGGEL